MIFRRKAHLRTNSYGTTFSVREHNVNTGSYTSFTYQSITIPNAQCPACGVSVFYYQNNYGSKVFFDELGPPWPKHPCTIQIKELVKIKLINCSKSYSWKNEGWQPVFDLNVKKQCSNWLFLKGFVGENKIEKYFLTDQSERFVLHKIDSPIFYKNEGKKQFFEFVVFQKRSSTKSRVSVLGVEESQWRKCRVLNCEHKKLQKILLYEIFIEDDGQNYNLKIADCIRRLDNAKHHHIIFISDTDCLIRFSYSNSQVEYYFAIRL